MAANPTTVLRKAIRSVAVGEASDATDAELLRRFVRDADQGAFATLVSRHAGMVFGVCQRSLPTVQDAEDACQATFLLLAQKAAACTGNRRSPTGSTSPAAAWPATPAWSPSGGPNAKPAPPSPMWCRPWIA